MKSRVKVEVFGVARNPQTGLNSLALQKYFSLVNYLQSSDAKDSVDLNFIDPTVTNIDNYPTVKNALQQGRPTPIIVVNGVAKYFGNIPYEAVYQDVKRTYAR